MATNKHAIIRYQALDRCFSNFGRKFFIDDLVEACSQAIFEYTGIDSGVRRRQVFDDIRFMESEAGYAIPLDKLKDGKRVYYRYRDKLFSIRMQPLSPTEAEQLKNTIMMLNRFKGLPQFDWMHELLARLEESFKLKTKVEGVVAFEQNPYLSGLEHFSDLFQAIINKQVLEIAYRASFADSSIYTIHPYFLKQYNNRWFLFGLSSDQSGGSLMNMAIDRIEGFRSAQAPYIENTRIDFDEYFDDVVGVTVPSNGNLQRVLLKIDRDRANYIVSKPFHPSQKVKKETSEEVVIELNLICNYEFETLLLGFADSIDILEPLDLKEAIRRRAGAIFERSSR